MGSIIQIKRGWGEPQQDSLKLGELGFDMTNKALYIGHAENETKQPSIFKIIDEDFINEMSGRISDAEENIENNIANIATNRAVIEELESDIEKAAESNAENLQLIQKNITDIAKNTDNIANNTSAISEFESDIEAYLKPFIKQLVIDLTKQNIDCPDYPWRDE